MITFDERSSQLVLRIICIGIVLGLKSVTLLSHGSQIMKCLPIHLLVKKFAPLGLCESGMADQEDF